MVYKKVCLLGSYCVGKSALVQRYVNSLFYDRYLSTLKVKISKKTVKLEASDINIVFWDMEGELSFMGYGGRAFF